MVVIFICSDVQWFLSAGYKVIWVSFLSVHFMHWPLMPIKLLTTSFCCNQGNHSVVTSCMRMCVKDLSNQFCLSICQCCEKDLKLAHSQWLYQAIGQMGFSPKHLFTNQTFTCILSCIHAWWHIVSPATSSYHFTNITAQAGTACMISTLQLVQSVAILAFIVTKTKTVVAPNAVFLFQCDVLLGTLCLFCCMTFLQVSCSHTLVVSVLQRWKKLAGVFQLVQIQIEKQHFGTRTVETHCYFCISCYPDGLHNVGQALWMWANCFYT